MRQHINDLNIMMPSGPHPCSQNIKINFSHPQGENLLVFHAFFMAVRSLWPWEWLTLGCRKESTEDRRHAQDGDLRNGHGDMLGMKIWVTVVLTCLGVRSGKWPCSVVCHQLFFLFFFSFSPGDTQELNDELPYDESYIR